MNGNTTQSISELIEEVDLEVFNDNSRSPTIQPRQNEDEADDEDEDEDDFNLDTFAALNSRPLSTTHTNRPPLSNVSSRQASVLSQSSSLSLLSDNMSGIRNSVMSDGRVKRTWHFKTTPLRDQGKYHQLITQVHLAAFYAETDGASVKSHQWPGIIKDLYSKVFELPSDTMPEGCLEAVFQHLCLLIVR